MAMRCLSPEVVAVPRGPQLEPPVLSDEEIAQLTAWSPCPKTARPHHPRRCDGHAHLTVAAAAGVTFQTAG